MKLDTLIYNQFKQQWRPVKHVKKNFKENGMLQSTGRYLGVTDGYFLYSESPNWVYCYCKPCWQKQILGLSFVQDAIRKGSAECVGVVQSGNIFEQVNLETEIAPLFRVLFDCINQAEKLTGTLTKNELKTQEFLNGLKKEIQGQVGAKIISFCEKVTENLQNSIQVAMSETAKIHKVKDQFQEFLANSGAQNLIDYDSHLRTFDADIKKYKIEEMISLMDTLRQTQLRIRFILSKQ
ncbi:hypothetical protein pb186bvf_000362 [Paramecium bursaria]